MEAVTYSAFRRELKTHMRNCRDNAETLIVTNNDPSENIVVMNKDDYDSLMETIRIYENPYLYEKIRRGDEQTRRGNYSIHELIDTADDAGEADA